MSSSVTLYCVHHWLELKHQQTKHISFQQFGIFLRVLHRVRVNAFYKRPDAKVCKYAKLQLISQSELLSTLEAYTTSLHTYALCTLQYRGAWCEFTDKFWNQQEIQDTPPFEQVGGECECMLVFSYDALCNYLRNILYSIKNLWATKSVRLNFK